MLRLPQQWWGPPLKRNAREESDEFDGLIGEQARINFCLSYTKDSDNLETNLEYESSEHSLYIPKIKHLSNLETTIRYLRIVITKYNKFLYCRIIKQSAEGIQW